MNVGGRKSIILILYDDILLICNDAALLHDVKEFLSNTFEIKDTSDASYVLGIVILERLYK